MSTTDGCQWANGNFVNEHTCEKTHPKTQLACKVERRHEVKSNSIEAKYLSVHHLRSFLCVSCVDLDTSVGGMNYCCSGELEAAL